MNIFGDPEGSRRVIEEKYRQIYAGKKSYDYDTIRKYNEGGAPLSGIVVYDTGAFWHYISFGMSELYEKTSQNTERSGWGFEFSLRLAKSSEPEPPLWVVSILQKLARYVFNERKPFGDGHFIPWGSPVLPEKNECLDSVLFSKDPQIGTLSTPTGKLVMLDVFFITQKDLDFCWRHEDASLKLIDAIRGQNALLVNDFSVTTEYSAG